MTTIKSFMRWRGPAVRVRPRRADSLRNWPILQLIAPACTFLQLRAVGRRERGLFFAANFTSCHVIACICRYIHIKNFSRMNHRGTISGSFGVLQRISGYSAYFSLNICFSKPRHTPLVTRHHSEASSLFQRIPTYSNVLFLQNPTHEYGTRAFSTNPAGQALPGRWRCCSSVRSRRSAVGAASL